MRILLLLRLMKYENFLGMTQGRSPGHCCISCQNILCLYPMCVILDKALEAWGAGLVSLLLLLQLPQLVSLSCKVHIPLQQLSSHQNEVLTAQTLRFDLNHGNVELTLWLLKASGNVSETRCQKCSFKLRTVCYSLWMCPLIH